MRSPGSFQRQLMVTITLSLVAFAFGIALVTSGLMQSQLRHLAVRVGADLTARLGANQAFALMATERRTVVEQALASLHTFPGVYYVALLRPDYTVLGSRGEAPRWALAKQAGEWRNRPSLVAEDSQRWYFATPVRSAPARDLFDDRPIQAQGSLIGYVLIAWDKTLLAPIEVLVYVVNGSVSVVAVGLLWGLLGWRVRRMTQPLSALVAVMQQARAGAAGDTLRAIPDGPQEVRAIAHAFNALYAQLEKHQSALESEVAIRTRDLQQARDDALTAVRHKSAFLTTITHEMRTPLHNVTYFAELAREELQFANHLDRPLVEEYLTVIHTKAHELLRLINRVLDFARSEAGKDDVRLGPVDLHPLLAQLLAAVKPLAERNGNTLQMRGVGLRTVTLDGDKVEQILSNLLTNACKFTYNGTITLHVRCTDEALTLAVQDTGIGIPADQRAVIFQPFTQVDMSDSRAVGGTGLGLAIAHSYCQLLGGRIAVHSVVNQGSTFTVTIPLPVAPPGADAARTAEWPIEARAQSPQNPAHDQNFTRN